MNKHTGIGRFLIIAVGKLSIQRIVCRTLGIYNPSQSVINEKDPRDRLQVTLG